MAYKFLTEVAHDLQGEAGTQDAERIPYLQDLAEDLRAAMRRVTRVAGAKPTAVGAGVGVAALKKYHETAASYDKNLEAAKAEVVRLRQWLARMGAVVDQNGFLNVAGSQKLVQYDTGLMDIGLTRIVVRGGLLYYDAPRRFVDTTDMTTAASGPGYGIYAMSSRGDVHVTHHSVGERHHSSLLAAHQQWIAGAGELKVRNGMLLWLSNKSGHYQPTMFHLLQVLHQLQKMGVPMTFQVKYYSAAGSTEYRTVDEFMDRNNLDNDSYDYNNLLHAYSQYLNPETLAPHGWEYRPAAAKPGIYDMYTQRLILHHEARIWLSSHGNKGTALQHSGAGR